MKFILLFLFNIIFATKLLNLPDGSYLKKIDSSKKCINFFVSPRKYFILHKINLLISEISENKVINSTNSYIDFEKEWQKNNRSVLLKENLYREIKKIVPEKSIDKEYEYCLNIIDKNSLS